MKAIINKYTNGFLNKCLSSEAGKSNKSSRDRWLSSILSELPEGSRILDAGAGELRNRPLCSHLNYVSQDFGQFTGNNPKAPGLGNQKKWDTSSVDIISDITNIPEPDESFDAILCSEVFEHIPNPIAALQELSRLLKPCGSLILTAPFNSLTHQAPFFYYTGYSRFFYQYWCEQNSLLIIELHENGNYFEYLAQELRRLRSVGKKYADFHFSFWHKLVIASTLNMINSLSIRNNRSEELLCFGYHLLAVKKK